ncbi:integrase [Pseudomonas veronii]|uniref:integrase n=1 Tax=Pseudomonas veronii TaxID=76761 RepID=UPI0021C0FF09|nr:integrase [Pseudomonas veronii]MCT9824818.1 integrase [Pseudomonas veronii]
MSIETYRQYRRILKNTPFNGKFMEYNWGELPESVDAMWMPYIQMFNEFSRELANVVNEFTRYTHQLAAWSDLLAPLDDRKKMNAILEFINPVATVAINLPYVIRSRFIFATAHLSHQANREKLGTAWKDTFPLDDEVFFDAADAHAKGWRRYKVLKKRMEGIGAKKYQKATNDFRNAYNHRFSPRIEVGITQVATRHTKPDGSILYSFGGVSPLPLTSIVTLLEAQCQCCYQTFEAFKLLIREHEEAIKSY